MKRREFITLLGGAAAWPLAAHAQRTKTPQVGILDPGISHLFEAFRQGMSDLGYIDLQNISYVYRSAEGQAERVPRLASELAGLQLDVIVTAGTLPVRAIKDATSTIPIVFAALGDAVATGAVGNLARPGGNITGLSFLNTEISAKRLGLLRETLPGAQRVAVFSDPSVVRSFVEATEEAARGLSLELRVLEIPAPDSFEGAFDAAVKWRADALNVLSSAFFNSQRVRIAELATKYRLPAMYESAEFVRAGGLIAYGASFYDLFRRAATYVDKIIKGAKPGELPVEQPSKFELVINLKTARTLGLEIPPKVLALADEVIE
jgi:putative ABC transport system substrate-binding protein